MYCAISDRFVVVIKTLTDERTPLGEKKLEVKAPAPVSFAWMPASGFRTEACEHPGLGLLQVPPDIAQGAPEWLGRPTRGWTPPPSCIDRSICASMA
jgi:hypothetical protein